MKKQVFLSLVMALFSAINVRADLPPLSTDELQAGAEVIITGRVAGARVMIHRKPASSVYFVRLKAEVDAIEKGGNLIADSRYLDIRCWRIRNHKGTGPAGHRHIPADGSRFRMWLKKNQDDKWEPLEPNGIELLDGSAEMGFAEVERKDAAKDFLIGGAAGVVTLITLAIFYFRRRRIR